MLLLIVLVMWGGQRTALADDRVATSETDTEKYALVIGIDRYRHQPWLQYAVNDARRLGEVFHALGYQVYSLLDFDADPDQVLRIINDIGELMDAGQGRTTGTLVVTYSGHGYARDQKNYLAMGHADPRNPGQGSLAVERIRHIMTASGIGRQFMFIDACRNDPSKSITGGETGFVPDETGEGLAIMYSTAPGAVSFEDVDLKHGVFSHYLATGLTESSPCTDDCPITFDALYAYVRRQVSSHVYTRFRARQIPYRAGENTGELALGSKQTLSGQVEPGIGQMTPATQASDVRPWRVIGTVVGILAVGALLASAASDSDDQSSNGAITLVIPTP